jgi:hypothetical protein
LSIVKRICKGRLLASARGNVVVTAYDVESSLRAADIRSVPRAAVDVSPVAQQARVQLEQRFRGARETFRQEAGHRLTFEQNMHGASHSFRNCRRSPAAEFFGGGPFGGHRGAHLGVLQASANPSLQRTTTGRSPGCRR